MKGFIKQKKNVKREIRGANGEKLRKMGGGAERKTGWKKRGKPVECRGPQII